MSDPDAPPRLLRPLFLATAGLCAALLTLPALLRADAVAAAGTIGLVGVFACLGAEPRLLAPRPASEPRRTRRLRALLGAFLLLGCGGLLLR